MSFYGKIAIVTGSSSGIGQEAAIIFATQGASVTIHGQSVERLKNTEELLKKANVPESRILSILGPIEEESTLQKLIDETIKKFGRIDILVNNAAATHQTNTTDPNSLDNLDYVMKTNLKSAIALTRLAVPHLEKTKGNVVNVSSIGGQMISLGTVPYTLTKAALDHYTRNSAVEYAEKGIRVNTVSPGLTYTNFATRHGISNEIFELICKDFIDNMIPMHRFGTAKEIANVIEFVASDKASYVTGATLVVDGGVLAGVPLKKAQS